MFQDPAKQPPLQQVLPGTEESFRVLELRGHATRCEWHFHPEHQLSVVVSGKGQRIVGDTICPIERGEVVLLGSNLPHVWKYDTDTTEIHAVVVHFHEDFAGTDFLNRPEMRTIRLLLARATHGLQVYGSCRSEVSAILKKLPEQSGFDRVLGLLTALNAIAGSGKLTSISSEGFGVGHRLDIERLRCVYTYLDEHLHDPVSRAQVAAVAHLNPNAFSRFFRQHTGLTFQDYLTERRIGRACELLMDISRPVTDVALDCGFSTPTSFTRAFRRVKGMTPSDYRDGIAKILR